ncbi:MAG: 50S ribosomal protein L36, partial [Erysipelotrichaceae bacterium]|nr:50S ribosomal protein L36 [Erysipelotrichaceae bacterium]
MKVRPSVKPMCD